MQQSTFVTGRIIFNSKTNFYQINVKQSLLRLFDSEGKLRMSCHLDIPQRCQIIPCDHYLIFFDINKISIMDLAAIGYNLISCEQHGIRDITHCVYNNECDLFFFTDSNKDMYYILYTMNKIQVKKIFHCHEIQSQITKIYVHKCENLEHSGISQISMDEKLKKRREPDIYIFESQRKKLLKVSFDFQDDSVVSRRVFNGIYDVYYENNWEVIVKEENKQRQQSQISRESNIQKTSLCLQIRYPAQYSSTIYENQLPLLIANHMNELLILDRNFQNIYLVHQRQFFKFEQKHTIFGIEAYNQIERDKQILFKIVNKNLSTIKVVIWAYDGIQSSFREYSQQFSRFQKEFNQNENPLLKIHNNIHKIFSSSGEINPHFSSEIMRYLGIDQNKFQNRVKISEKGLLLFYTLLKENPQTISKLNSTIISNSIWEKTTYNMKRQEENLEKFKKWTTKILDDLVVQISETFPRYFSDQNSIKHECRSYKLESKHLMKSQQKEDKQKGDKQKGDKQQEKKRLQQENKRLQQKQKIECWLKIIRSLVKFLAILKQSIDTNNLIFCEKNKTNSKKYTIAIPLAENLNRAKSIYLTLQAIQKLGMLMRDDEYKIENWMIKINKYSPSTLAEAHKINDGISSTLIHFFNKKLLGQISLSKVISYMATSHCFIQTAFLYLCVCPPSEDLNDLPTISYLNHAAHKQILSFLYNCEPHNEIENVTKLVNSSLLKIASSTLILPFPQNKPFIKQLMILSIVHEEFVTASEILQSGFCGIWIEHSLNELAKLDKNEGNPQISKEQYQEEISFIIDCYCKCNKIQEGHQFLKMVCEKSKKYSHKMSEFEYKNQFKAIINRAIQIEKISLLFKLGADQSLVMSELEKKFQKEDIQKIHELAKKIKI